METFSSEGIYIIKGDTSLSSDQEMMLTKCYLPIIDNKSYSLYHVFLFNKRDDAYLTFENIESMSGLNIVDFTLCMHKLEAIGLIGTYFKQTGKKITYIIKLFIPTTPKAFFSNILLASLLESKIGKRKFKAIKNSLISKDNIPEGFDDISSKFEDVYNEVVPDFDAIESTNLKDSEAKEIEIRFNSNEFISYLKEEHIDPSVLKDNINEIERISSLYGISSKNAAYFINKYCIDSYGNFILAVYKQKAMNYSHYKMEDVSYSKQEVFGTSDFAKRAMLMEKTAPLIYLQQLLQMDAPKAYKDLIDEISSTYNCPNSVLNASIDYTLSKCKGSIPNQYLIKVVVSLLTNKITNASDAMAFLYQQNKKYITKKNNKSIPTYKKEVEEEINKEQDQDIEDINIDDILGEDDI